MAIRAKQKLATSFALAVVCLAAVGCGLDVTGAGASTRCVQNLLKIGLALGNHHDELGSFPKAAISDKEGRPGLSWRVAILPFLGEAELYAKFKLDEPWDSPSNKLLLSQMPEVFACPSAPAGDPSLTCYQSFVGSKAFLEPAYDKRLEKVWWVGDDGTKHYAGEPKGGLHLANFTDGMANTLMVVEAKQGVPWTKPEDLPFDPAKPSAPLFGAGSGHAGGFHVVFADASVWYLPNKISPELFRALITRNGDEVASLDRSSMFRGGRVAPVPPENNRPTDPGKAMRK